MAPQKPKHKFHSLPIANGHQVAHARLHPIIPTPHEKWAKGYVWQHCFSPIAGFAMPFLVQPLSGPVDTIQTGG